MPDPASTLDKLVALAREPACGRRRQLLHEVTDPLFAAPPEQYGRKDLDAVLSLVAEHMAAAEYARRARLRRRLDGGLLCRLIRNGEQARAIECFAQLADIDYEAAHGVFADPSNELLAMVCKAQGMPRALFVTIAILREGAEDSTVEAAAAIADLYDRTPLSEAERAMRFWRLRKHAMGSAAAPAAASDSARPSSTRAA